MVTLFVEARISNKRQIIINETVSRVFTLWTRLYRTSERKKFVQKFHFVSRCDYGILPFRPLSLRETGISTCDSVRSRRLD